MKGSAGLSEHFHVVGFGFYLTRIRLNLARQLIKIRISLAIHRLTLGVSSKV